MSQPFSFTHSACFNSISSHSSNPEYINTKIKMPFCPRVWHLARLGHTQPMAYHSSCCWDCSERPEHRTASAAKHCFVLWKFFVEETGEQTGGMECYFIYWKQITLSLILQAFFAEEKKNPCFILRFLVWFILRFRKHKRVRPSRQMHLPWRNAFAIALQQWPREYLQFTLDFFFFLFFFSYCLENGPGSRA